MSLSGGPNSEARGITSFASKRARIWAIFSIHGCTSVAFATLGGQILTGRRAADAATQQYSQNNSPPRRSLDRWHGYTSEITRTNPPRTCFEKFPWPTCATVLTTLTQFARSARTLAKFAQNWTSFNRSGRCAKYAHYMLQRLVPSIFGLCSGVCPKTGAAEGICWSTLTF